MKKYRFNIIFCLVSILFLVVYILMIDASEEKFAWLLQNLHFGWILFGVGSLLAYLWLDSFILHIFIKKMHRQQPFVNSARVSLIGQYFNCITPFASGGQPMQAYALCSDGIPLSIASTALLSKFIIFQAALVVLTLFCLIVKFNFFVTEISSFVMTAIIGFAVNFFVLFLLISVGIFPSFTKKLMFFCIKCIKRFKLTKFIKRDLDNVDDLIVKINDFHAQFQYVRKNVALGLYSGVLSLIQLIFFFLIPYAIYRSLGLYSDDILSIISGAAFVMLISAFIPIPGTVGVSEGSFFLLFNIFFQNHLISFAVLIWRIITFVLPLILGASAVMIKTKKTKILITEDS